MVKYIKQIAAASAGVVLLAGAVAGFGLASSAGAQGELKSGENVIQTSSVDGPFFGAGTNVQVTESVDGDLYAAGQVVTITGDVTGDVLVAAQTVTISGTVAGDVRGMAQSLTVTGSVAGSVSAAGQNLVLTEQSSVGRDVAFAGESVLLHGSIGRDAHVAAADLVLGGSVGRDVNYTSEHRLTQNADATVGGETIYTEVTTTHQGSSLLTTSVMRLVYVFLALGLAAILVSLVTPRWLRSVVDRARPAPWKALLAGVVVVFAAPVVLVLFAISVIGLPIAVALLLIYLVMLMAGSVFAAHYIGQVVLRNRQHVVVQGLVGAAVVAVLFALPVVNMVAGLVVTLLGLGMLTLDTARRLSFGYEGKAKKA